MSTKTRHHYLHLHGFFDPAGDSDVSDFVSLAVDSPRVGGDIDLLDDVRV